ncbi:MAG: TonB-dependent receptor [Flavobacteriales bacterium]|nr:TonB-dependent receptor [Flavobacteriales bacterium]
MKKLLAIAIIVTSFIPRIIGQELTQTVRGTVIDLDSEIPLIGAVVSIVGSNPLIGTATDQEGKFKLDNVETGRVHLKISYLGYENMSIPNIVVNSGKEVVLNLKMRESIIKMDEVLITASRNKGEAVNEMALISSRSISLEESKRYVGSFNDPSRVIANLAGVATTGDGTSDIIVRGNAPKYIQWRLEGMEITSPYHFNDQNSSSGGLSALNNSLLATSDFYTGAFSPEYGNVLSGVFDVKLRPGNNEKFESSFGFGLLGTDFTVEGPFKKGYGGSYLVNYRYSTISLIDDLGLVDIGGIPKFQDAAFKVVLPSKKMGTFSFFGLAGYSTLELEEVTPDVWTTPGEGNTDGNLEEDFDKHAFLANLGMNHTIGINDNSYIKTTLAYSTEGIEDDVFETRKLKLYDAGGVFLRDSLGRRTSNFKSRLKQSVYRGTVKYSNKLNARNSIQVGSKYAVLAYNNKQSQLTTDRANRTSLVDFDEAITTINNYVSWKFRLNENITFISGFHNMNVLLSEESSFEPRLAMNWKLNELNSIHVGYGNHSNMESVHNYFTQVELSDGSIVEPNKNLGLLKSHHFVLGYDRRLNQNLRAKAEVYYQDLYRLPVENDVNSLYSTINEGLDYQYVDLVNKGTGKNYGIELTVERFFANNYYFLLNGSLFDSKYKALDGVERSTRYNGEYIFNALAGKEFVKLGKKQNRTVAVNTKLFYAGGKKVISLVRDSEGNATNALDLENAYEEKIEDLLSLDVSVSYKFDRPKAAHELSIDLINLTDFKGKISEFYSEEEPKSIGYVTQFGFFPNLMYRVYF